MRLPNLSFYNFLLLAFGLLLLLELLFFRSQIYPLQQQLRQQQEELTQLRQRLTGNKWPTQLASLQELQQEWRQELQGSPGVPGLEKQAQTLLQQSSSKFRERIKSQYSNLEDFRLGASRLDYQEEFNRLQNRFLEQGVYLAPQVLGLAEEKDSGYNYQRLLQLWSLERLCDSAAAAGMQFVSEPKYQMKSLAGQSISAAQITLQPILAYLPEAGNPNPYLLEFPLQCSLRGQWPQLRQFIALLRQPDTFLPVLNFELYSETPLSLAAAEDGKLLPGSLRLELLCAAYFER